MQQAKFIIREPLLDAKEHVLGYELKWQSDGSAEWMASEDDATALVRAVIEQTKSTGKDALLDGHLLFLAAPAELLKANAFAELSANGTVLAVTPDDLADAAVPELLKARRAEGYGVSLRGASAGVIDPAIVALLTHIEVPAQDAGAAQAWKAQKLPSGVRLVARGASDWQQFDACAALGMDAFVGQLHLTPRHDSRSRDLNPAQAMILQAMDMVRKGADVRQLEGVLKRDAALSYKLLRYINSAGLGLGCEVQSLKHAVTLLGYSPLYRWLALLLATANTAGYSPVLMQTAVIRGRFAELLGHAFLPKNEAENLFVAGMFSLLDKLLGAAMEDILEKIPLSNDVSEALLSRQGIYGPFLALAEACELNSPELDAMATALCISPHQVNQAHLSSLAWVQGMKL